ncbi:peptidyl-prolyl cis-trans isomerase [Streptomyces sp. B21-083]|uniref:peptidyl-prolyl cis-trans isomerase n=1 Tax=Streptomyces sp. B21-083 TaxID=3039410 RepID=UPI002FF2ADA1
MNEHEHDHMHPHTRLPEGACALVQGEYVPREQVEAVLTAVPARGAPPKGRGELRDQPPPTGSQHTTLPAERAAERQRRRWATQVVVADVLARRACAERGLRPPEAAPQGLRAVPEADVAGLGSIVAVVLAYSAAARVLLGHLEAHQAIPEEALWEYYVHNRDRFLTQDAMRRGVDPYGPSGGPLSEPAEPDFLPYEQVKAGIEGELRQAAGRRAFFSWLDLARADVVYAPGHEHPGDPSHPDHEHRH